MAEPFYESSRVRLYCGDTTEILPTLTLPPVPAVLCDPPYASWAYISWLEQQSQIDVVRDGQWQADMFAWFAKWILPLRKQMAEDGVAVFFTNTHYLGFYVRWARLMRWGWSGLWTIPPDELLVRLANHEPAPGESELIQQAGVLNTYGQDKPVPMLCEMLHLMPEGLVLDPFAGGCNTLIAAMQCGRPAVGIEIDEPRCAMAAERLRVFEQNHPVSSESALLESR